MTFILNKLKKTILTGISGEEVEDCVQTVSPFGKQFRPDDYDHDVAVESGSKGKQKAHTVKYDLDDFGVCCIISRNTVLAVNILHI